jgi:hypothetical protein
MRELSRRRFIGISLAAATYAAGVAVGYKFIKPEQDKFTPEAEYSKFELVSQIPSVT